LLSLRTNRPKWAKRSGKKRPKIRKLRRVVRVSSANIHRMNKKLVLLVNADPETENLVRAGTSAGGQRLYIAEGCADAFRIAAKHIHELALIILDLDRPGGGVPLLAAFEIAHLPTVTISRRREVAAVAVKHGALACWTNPVSAESVEQALDYLAPITAVELLALAA
jgi:DNA-binding NtrC family response regulator